MADILNGDFFKAFKYHSSLFFMTTLKVRYYSI